MDGHRPSIADKRRAFRQLHKRGCFVMPNPWDPGSARYLESLGFKAVATTSAGFAWSLARQDYGVTVDEVIEHLRAMVAAVDIPVNADFESGFASRTEARSAAEPGLKRVHHRTNNAGANNRRRDDLNCTAPEDLTVGE